MHIDEIQQLHGYTHVYLSPHLDDAALSCGGAIASQRSAGERVLVVTLCTASPAPDSHFSDLALELHQQWGLAVEEVVAARLREERRALALLDADSFWAGELDAIYRNPKAYINRETLFNLPDPNDPMLPSLRALVGALREQLPGARFYAPMGIGKHVDHQITHTAALDVLGAALRFYEDVPYAIKPGAIDQRLSMLSGTWRAETIAIDPAFPIKLDAIRAYTSQLFELFGGEEEMVRSISAYSRSIPAADGSYGERLWLHEA